jgi:hypothetical protein
MSIPKCDHERHLFKVSPREVDIRISRIQQKVFEHNKQTFFTWFIHYNGSTFSNYEYVVTFLTHSHGMYTTPTKFVYPTVHDEWEELNSLIKMEYFTSKGFKKMWMRYHLDIWYKQDELKTVF